MAWNPALEGRGIVTDEEMQTFLENMKFEIKREEREINDKNETSGKKKIVNLVLYFTPFEGKYLNYIRRWSTNLYGMTKKRNHYYITYNEADRLYYNYNIPDGYSVYNVRPYGPGGHCIHMGISFYKLSRQSYSFGRLRGPNLFRRKLIIKENQYPDSIKLSKTFHDKDNYVQAQHHCWVYPRKFKGLLINRYGIDYVAREFTVNGAESGNTQGNPCQNYIRRGLLRPLTPQEASRGYMIFYSTQLESCHGGLATDEGIAEGNASNSQNGYCGYVEHMQQRILTTDCIRGPKNIEHNNRPTK